MKKKVVFILAVIALLILLGSLLVDQAGDGVFPSPTNTSIDRITFTDTPTQPISPTQPPANVTCNGITFYLDPALGSGYECLTVPESTDMPYFPLIYPTHTELTLQDYPLTNTQFPPQVLVYPVNRFNELLPDIIPPRVTKLENIISGGARDSGELPFLPAILERQNFYCHVANMSFNGGQGIRFLTAYSESINPISNRSLIYTFQGLTDDGLYWLALTLPISSPILPADYEALPEGYTRESLIQNYDSYANDLKNALETQAPDSFMPTINSLDNLVKSITLRP